MATIRIQITGPRASGKTLILREIETLLEPLAHSVKAYPGGIDGPADTDVLLIETDDESIPKLVERMRTL